MKSKYEYTINIEYNTTDKCYLATVPDLSPYLSAFGNTYEEALKEIQVVIRLTLESYNDEKVSPPKPKRIKRAI